MADMKNRGGEKVGKEDPQHKKQGESVHPATDKTFKEQVQEVKQERAGQEQQER